MFCPKCGAKNNNGAQFCKECGSKLGVGSTVANNGPIHSTNRDSNKTILYICVTVVVCVAIIAGAILAFNMASNNDDAESIVVNNDTNNTTLVTKEKPKSNTNGGYKLSPSECIGSGRHSKTPGSICPNCGEYVNYDYGNNHNGISLSECIAQGTHDTDGDGYCTRCGN